MPPNFGAKYTAEFDKVFQKLAKKYDLIFIPFLLDRVGGEKNLNQGDGIHPNEKGHQIMADTVYKILEPKLK